MATLTAPAPSPSSRYSSLGLIARWLVGLAALSVIVASCAGLALGAMELFYQDSVYAGISVRGIDLAGLTKAQPVDRLSAQFNYPQIPSFTFRDKDRAWAATPTQRGVRFAVTETVDRAYGYGRS